MSEMILGILQARMSSSRFPGKVLQPILGVPMLARQLERVRRAKNIDKLVVATSTDSSDDVLEKFCQENGTACARGSLDDVLDRFYQAALPYAPEQVVRLTGDCPLADPEIVDRIIAFHLEGEYDYTSNTLEPTFPDGLDAEVLQFAALERAWREAILPSEREHVTLFVYRRPREFRLGSYKCSNDRSHLRWTVDRPEDLCVVREIYSALYPVNPCFDADEVFAYLEKNPDIQARNQLHARNEGLRTSIRKDQEFCEKRNGW
jgi:spore coat polysaccharide biosynthesis protein SpsF